jgi:hypothetical protein
MGDVMSKSLKGKYPTAWSLYTAWGKLELPVRATPFSAEDVMALSCICLQRGMRGFSIGMHIAFHCVFRTGEMLGLE